MYGFLNLDKPPGMTSHDVVASIRRMVGRGIKVGHAGTLDPAATGVLPIALGQATRLIEYLSDAHKGYRGLVRLGITTTTDDAEGEICNQQPVPPLTDAQIEAAVARLRGAIMQVPPHYSALHHQGRRLYDLARAGETVTLPPRPVMIYHLVWHRLGEDTLSLEVTCGKGTYIRALARDLGATLGCGAHLATLERTFVGHFSLANALPLNTLRDNPDLLTAALLPPAIAIADWTAIIVDDELAQRIAHGMPVTLPPMAGMYLRAHCSDQSLLALLKRQEADHHVWQPIKVFHPGPG
ncbi:MAG: tRNA pseudouridine(55) synthase TruB [Chloroflexia bacterium]|nr:tRNA pseudouridine(55) synthase TruB [Chloroflexia bacterium]